VITQPTTARLIDVVRTELIHQIAPNVDNPQAQASLQMIDHILSTIAVRAEHEIAWMVEEVDALCALGQEIVAAHPNSTSVAAALVAVDDTVGSSLHYRDVSERYSRASELLSLAYETTPHDSPLRPQVETLFDLRLEHEVDIMGEFQLVGRE
jgi:hypothetical protein